MRSPSEQMNQVRWSTIVVAGPVELLGQQALGQGEPDGVAEALTQRARGDLDPGGVAALRMTRGGRAPLAELLQVVDRHRVPGQVQQRVQQRRRVAGRQHEAVAVGPFGVERVVAQVVSEQHPADRREAHRGAGVAAVGALDRVDGEGADGRDHQLVGGEIDGHANLSTDVHWGRTSLAAAACARPHRSQGAMRTNGTHGGRSVGGG